VKRRVTVKTTTIIGAHLEPIIGAFGFKTIHVCSVFYIALAIIDTTQAPGEAEAELVAMNQNGICDFILTTNVDMFLFRGLKVIIQER
jgi:5'-3' exonuclease